MFWQKRVVYMLAFVEYFKLSKEKKELVKPKFNAAKLDEATHAIVAYVQHKHYNEALRVLLNKHLEDLLHANDRCSQLESNEPKIWLS